MKKMAEEILNRMAAHFGLGRVEGKQVVPGLLSYLQELPLDVR
jgi:hypothetical protein